MISRRRHLRSFRSAHFDLLEALESRTLLCSDGSIPPPPDDGTTTQPVTTQPVDTQPVDTQPAPPDDSGSGSGDGSSDSGDGSSDFGGDDGYDPFPPDSTDTLSAPDAPHVSLQLIPTAAVDITWNSDPTVDTYDVSRLDSSGHWKPLAQLDGSVNRFTDTNLQVGATYAYRVLAINDAGSTFSNRATLTVSDPSDPTLIGTFGHVLGASTAPVPLTFVDADGTRITLNLNGPGTGSLHLNPDGYDMTLTATTTATTLNIRTTKTSSKTDDGRFTLNSLTAGNAQDSADHTSLGALTAATTDLTGNLTFTGSAGRITLDQINGGTWQINGPVNSITARSASNWTLDLNTVSTGIANSLKSLTIRGAFANSQLRATGNIGAISAGQLDHTNLFAGVLPTLNTLPASPSDFLSTSPAELPTITSIKLTGIPGSPAVLIDSDIAAGTILKATLPSRPTAISDPDLSNPFGFATLASPVKKYQGPLSTGNFISGTNSAIA